MTEDPQEASPGTKDDKDYSLEDVPRRLQAQGKIENRGGNPIFKRLKKDWINVNGKVKTPVQGCGLGLPHQDENRHKLNKGNYGL